MDAFKDFIHTARTRLCYDMTEADIVQELVDAHCTVEQAHWIVQAAAFENRMVESGGVIVGKKPLLKFHIRCPHCLRETTVSGSALKHYDKKPGDTVEWPCPCANFKSVDQSILEVS